MEICDLAPLTPACLTGGAAGAVVGSAAEGVLDSIGQTFAKGAEAVLDAVFEAMGGATRVDLGASYVTSNAMAMASVALVIVVGLFVVQVVAAAIRQEPRGLSRAVVGAGVAVLGTAAAAGITQSLLIAVDQVCEGIAQLAGTSIEDAARRLLDVSLLLQLAPGGGGAALMILFGLLFILGATLTLGTLLVRQALIVVAVVVAPLAFAGGTARITSGWARRWVQVTLALILSKLAIVLVFVVAVGMVGDATGLGALLSGLILLLLACLAPWACFKFLEFAGTAVAGEWHRATNGATIAAANQGRMSAQSMMRTVAPIVGGPAGGAAAAGAGVGRVGRCRSASRGVAAGGSRAGRARHPHHHVRRRIRGIAATDRWLRTGPRRGRGPAPDHDQSRNPEGSRMTATTNQTADPNTRAGTVRFGRRSSRGVILGLSAARLAAIGIAVCVVVPAVYLAGMPGVLWTSPIWGAAVASAFVTVAGRRAVEWVPVYGHWLARRALHQDVYGVRVLAPRPAGTLALPGDAAALRLHHDPGTGAAMIHDPHGNTLTAVARLRHPSFILLSPAEQQRRVAGLARVYATACASGRIARVQILERTLPDSGQGVRRHWQANARPRSDWAAEQYQQLVDAAGPTTERHETTISISLDLARAKRAVRAEGSGMPGAAAVLRRELATIVAALRAADVTVEGFVGPEDLALLLRSAYDPAAAPQRSAGRDPATAGPTGVVEHWDHLVSDSGHHAVYWISEWPRSEVFPTFLSSLLLAPGVRRATSIVAQPLTTAEAMRAIRKERVEYQTDAAHRARIGQLTDFASEQEWADVTQRERDLVAGHGDLRYAGFVSVTAGDPDALAAARAAIEQAAIQSGCETRLLVGQQAQAFTAAALPLCRGI